MNIVKSVIIALIALAFTSVRAEMAAPAAKESPAPAATEKAATKHVSKSGNPTGPTSRAKTKTGTTPRLASDKATDKPADKSVAKTPAKPALDLTPTQEDKLLALLNRGTAEELTAISGIATTRAESIVSARPFQNLHEVILVPGVGDATFERILDHGKTLTQSAAKSAKS